jgi:hypothetical protein
MCGREIIYLRPDRPDLIGFAAIQAKALIEH